MSEFKDITKQTLCNLPYPQKLFLRLIKEQGKKCLKSGMKGQLYTWFWFNKLISIFSHGLRNDIKDKVFWQIVGTYF